MFRFRLTGESGQPIGPILVSSGDAEEVKQEHMRWSEQLNAWVRPAHEVPGEHHGLIEGGVYLFHGPTYVKRFVAQASGDIWSWTLDSIEGHIDAMLGEGDSHDCWLVDVSSILYDNDLQPVGSVGELEFTGLMLIGAVSDNLTPERARSVNRSVQSAVIKWDKEYAEDMVRESELAAAADEQEHSMGM